MNELIKKSAAESFAANPKINMLHATRDGLCFEKWHDANEHSKTLGSTDEDRKLLEVTPADVANPSESEEPKKGRK